MIAGLAVDQSVGFFVPGTLIQADVLTATSMAHQAIHANRARGWQNKFPFRGETELDGKIRGFCGECFVARLTGLRWNNGPLPAGYRREAKTPDVGNRTEVRTPRSQWAGLWSRSGDRDEWLYVLVIGTVPIFQAVGWIEGRDFRVPQNWREGRDGRPGGYWLPYTDLNPFPLPDDA